MESNGAGPWNGLQLSIEFILKVNSNKSFQWFQTIERVATF
jgi:hypothetical protein